jgi:hypothetical protein
MCLLMNVPAFTVILDLFNHVKRADGGMNIMRNICLRMFGRRVKP